MQTAVAGRILMVDVTTTLAEAGRIAHGTTRVERGIVGGLLACDPAGLSFCRFDRGRQRFVEVPRDELMTALARQPAAETSRSAPSSKTASRLSLTMKQVEWLVRRRIRDPILRQMNAVRRLIVRRNFPAGTTFLSVGEIRFDLDLFSAIVEHGQASFVSTIFDVLPIASAKLPNPGPSERRMIAIFDTMFRLSRLCLCISQATLRDVVEYARIRGLACPDCVVIPMAQDLPVATARMPLEVDLEPGHYVLAVGTITRRKNQKMLVDIWKHFVDGGLHPSCKLVLVGNVAADSHDLPREVRSRHDLASRVLVLENADDSVLAWLYANCRFTVFPSFLEGFGLPVAESLAAGKVCVASSSSAIPEAAQGQAILLPPGETQSWISTISELIDDDERIRQAEQAISSFYRRQQWSDTAKRILELLDERGLISDGPSSTRA
jgi:glycosyltransferase involved in cell wall biosynthesis